MQAGGIFVGFLSLCVCLVVLSFACLAVMHLEFLLCGGSEIK